MAIQEISKEFLAFDPKLVKRVESFSYTNKTKENKRTFVFKRYIFGICIHKKTIERTKEKKEAGKEIHIHLKDGSTLSYSTTPLATATKVWDEIMLAISAKRLPIKKLPTKKATPKKK